MKGKFPSLDPPTRFYFLVGSPCYLPFFFFTSIIVVYLDSFNLDWYPSRLAPMYFFLGTHCGGRRCALPPAPLHPLLFFNRFPLLPAILSLFFISITVSLGGRSKFLNLYLYPSRLEPMCFFLGVRCGGRRCALPPAPPHPLLFLFWASLATYTLSFFHKHHRLFGFIFSFLIFVDSPSPLVPMCFFLGAHCGGRRCALPPAPPHPLLFFNRLPLLPTLFLFFSQASFIWVYFLYNQYFHSCCYYYDYYFYYYYYCYY